MLSAWPKLTHLHVPLARPNPALLSNLVVNPSHNLNYLSVRVDSEQDRLLVKDLIAAAAESLTSLELVTSTFPVDFTPLFEVLPINLRYLKCLTPTFDGSQRVTPTLDGNQSPLDYLTRLLPLLVNLKKLAIVISGYKDLLPGSTATSEGFSDRGGYTVHSPGSC